MRSLFYRNLRPQSDTKCGVGRQPPLQVNRGVASTRIDATGTDCRKQADIHGCRNWPKLTKRWPKSTNVGRDVPKSDQVRTELDQTWFDVGQICPTFAKVGPSSNTFGRNRPNWTQFGQSWPKPTKFGPASIRFDQIWLDADGVGPKSANFGPTLGKFGRNSETRAEIDRTLRWIERPGRT